MESYRNIGGFGFARYRRTVITGKYQSALAILSAYVTKLSIQNSYPDTNDTKHYVKQRKVLRKVRILIRSKYTYSSFPISGSNTGTGTGSRIMTVSAADVSCLGKWQNLRPGRGRGFFRGGKNFFDPRTGGLEFFWPLDKEGARIFSCLVRGAIFFYDTFSKKCLN